MRWFRKPSKKLQPITVTDVQGNALLSAFPFAPGGLMFGTEHYDEAYISTDPAKSQRSFDAWRAAGDRLNPPSSESLAKAWWEGANAQWKHRPIGNRIPESENPYRRNE